MSYTAPLKQIQERCGAGFIRCGPSQEASSTGSELGESVEGVELVESFGSYEAEYAAIRQRVGLAHMPQSGLVELAGSDRTDFLQRILTNNVADLNPGESQRSFLLNQKGRIVADLMVLQDKSVTLMVVDVFDVDNVIKTLKSMLFAEDIAIRNLSNSYELLVLHGPAAPQVVKQMDVSRKDISLDVLSHCTVHLSAASCVLYRHDVAGEPGLHLLVPSERVAQIYQQLLDVLGFEPGRVVDADFGSHRRQTLRGWPVGWLALNTARIEAGTPIFHIDFGTDSLPAETAVMDEAVSFTKGCYVGQEIVARMHNLGHPKRLLVGFRVKGSTLPIAGAQVFEPSAQQDLMANSQQIIGGVTSSTVSPLLGRAVVGFAVMKWGRHAVDTPILVPAEGQLVEAQIHDVRFLKGL